MINQEKQLEDLILQVKKLPSANTKIERLIQFLQGKVVSSDHTDCLIIEKILAYTEGESDASLPALSSKQIFQVINSCIKGIKSLSILIVLYNAWQKCKKVSFADINWKGEYEKKNSQGFLNEFNIWVQSTCNAKPVLCNQVLSRVMAGLPNFFLLQKIRSSYLEFDSCLLWMSVFTIKSREDHLCALRAARLVKEATDIKINNDFQKKEHLILRRVIELLGSNERKNNSLYLFFDKFTIRSEQIEYFINIHEDFFQDLDEKHLCNVFSALVQSGLNKEILQFFRKISGLLKSNQQYYILRTLFEQIVLPIVAAKYKSHRKLAQDVFDFVLFYIAGFLAHCFIGEIGIQCLLENLQDVETKGLTRCWGELAVLSCKDDEELKKKCLKQLEKVGVFDVSTNPLMNHISKEHMIWTVTLHNGRKLKKYPQIQSHRFKGIKNLNNQCYIISVVQALFTTEELKNIVINVKLEAKDKKLKVLQELWYLFASDLNIQTKENKATVKYLKNLGPEDFRVTLRQEDAQQYLVKLFECLQLELSKTAQGLKSFIDAFRAQCVVKICCKECKAERELKDHQFHYVSTYGTKQFFQMKKEEPLDENYKCQKCSLKKCVKITTMINQPKILILHINRFRHNEGETKKILGNNPIKRVIGDYKLVGFVAHKGTYIHAGHYQYYSRIDGNRWALFNDIKVTEFNVGEDEQFEREFRAENTPYLLFYRLNKYVK